MTNVLLQLLELTVSMSLLIAFILLFFRLFGKKFTAKCKYIVWTIVILRLCLPVGILSITPIFEIKVPSVQSTVLNTPNSGAKGDTATDVPQAGATAASPDINAQTPTVTPDIIPNVIPDITPKPTPTPSSPDTPALPSDIVTKNDSNNASENIHHGAQASENEVQKNAFSISSDMIPILICMVWLIGALIFIGARLILYAIYVLRMNKDGLLHTPSEKVETIYKASCLKLGVKRPPKLLVSRVPVSPHLCGFMRRKIIIPDMTYAMNDIESILSHELTHCKRGDLYVKLACTAAQAVSWFNPLVHLASGKCISEMELSCDEAVLKNSNEEERILYGNAMLDIVRRCGHVKGSYLTSDFKPKRGAVKERIMNIINNEKKKKGIGIIAAALALCITAGTVIGCTVAASESEKKENDTKVTEKEVPEETETETTEPEETEHIETEPIMTEPIETERVGEFISENIPQATKIPLQGPPVTRGTPEQCAYLGTWYTDENKTENITIEEITDNTVKFKSGLGSFEKAGASSRYAATAVKHSDEFEFGKDISEFSGTDTADVLKGRLIFEENSITVIYDSFGENAASPLKDGDIYRFTLREEINDMRSFAESFKNKDPYGCASVCEKYSTYSDKDYLKYFEQIGSLEFSEFYIFEDIDEYGFIYTHANFTVSKSESAAFPVGQYQTYFSISPYGLYWHLKKPNEITLDEEQTEAYRFIMHLLPCMGKQAYNPGLYNEIYKNDPSMGFVIPDNVFDMACKMKGIEINENSSVTLSELQAAAEEGLGIKDFYPGEYSFLREENGKYYIGGHCGLYDDTQIRDISKVGDILYFDIEYYNDSTFCSLGNVVRFTVRKTDSKIGYRLEKTEIIEENYTPNFANY